MANIKIDYINVYPIIEEHCQANQLIAEVKVSRTDSNPPNIQYLPYDTSDVYKYISINPDTGKIYLTLEGVNAINQDYPDDPSQEINELDFKVIAKDKEVGDSIDIDVKVAVIRIHDEPPKVVDEVKYKLYQDDLKVDYRVLDVRTEFPAYFISKTQYITFKVEDIGRATLTGDGVDYFKNLDTSNGPQTFEFQYNIVDQYNNKEITRSVLLEIVSGSDYEKVPKKAILSEIGGLLGKDLGEKIEYIRAKLNDQDDKVQKILDDLINENYLLKNFKGPALTDLYINDDRNIIAILKDELDRILEKTQKNETNLLQSNSIITSELYKNINYYLDNKIEFSDLSIYNEPEEFFAKIIDNNIQEIDNIINQKISVVLDLTKNTIENAVSVLLNELSNFQLDYATFKTITYCNDYNDFDKKIKYLQTFADYVCQAIDSKAYETFLNADSTDAWKKYVANIKNGTADDILTRLNNDETQIQANKEAIDNINSKCLEDWGCDSKWKMITSGSNGSIVHSEHTIIYSSNGSDTVRFGNSDTTSTNYLYTKNIRLSLSGDNATFTSNGTTTVKADIFDGTATKAKYADLAEYYEADQKYEYGTVLMIGGEKEVTLPQNLIAKNYVPIVGIVSENPGFIINSKEEENELAVPIALKGRTPVKILPSLEIFKGQRLYASLKHPGFATTINEFERHREDLFLGYSLESKKFNEVKRYIEIFIK